MKDIKDYNTICGKKGKYYERDKTGKGFITSFQLSEILMDSVDSLITPMELTNDIMNTQFYDKVGDYKKHHNKKNCRLETYEERVTDHYKIFFYFETIANGVKHEPYLCWVYNNDIQQECICINTCAQDMKCLAYR